MTEDNSNKLTTARLTLRQWRVSDRPAFAALNADSRVMEYFPAPLRQKESDAALDSYQTAIARRGWGFWAVERNDTAEFIGMVGIAEPADLPFSPCVEIGWRLAFPHWRQGFASEAATEALRFAFEELALAEIVSFTPLLNQPSCAVMRNIGMHDTGQTFAHPAIAKDNELSRHCLYNITRKDWIKQRKT